MTKAMMSRFIIGNDTFIFKQMKNRGCLVNNSKSTENYILELQTASKELWLFTSQG